VLACLCAQIISQLLRGSLQKLVAVHQVKYDSFLHSAAAGVRWVSDAVSTRNMQLSMPAAKQNSAVTDAAMSQSMSGQQT
jgi:hypothetical protein